MKTINILLFSLIAHYCCKGQAAPSKKIYNEDFRWSITIPEHFERVPLEELAKIQNEGAESIERTYDVKVTNQAKTIFVLKSDELNYFESNYQRFDTAVDGNYREVRASVNYMLYNTFRTQIPDATIDTAWTIEKIDNLEFLTFKMKVVYPNKMILNALMYNRLFGKRELTVNIMYVDPLKGQQMLDSWKQSTFGR